MIVGKFLKVISLYINTLEICLKMLRFVRLNRSWCLVSTGEELFSRIEKKYTTILEVDPWEPHCRELCPDNDTCKAIIGSNWLSVDARIWTNSGRTLSCRNGQPRPRVLRRCIGASLPSKLCVEAMQIEIQYMREIDVHTPCVHETAEEPGFTPIGTRGIFTNKGDTERSFIRTRIVTQEMKKMTKMDLTDTFTRFAGTPPVERFRFLHSRAMTSEKRRTHKTSWSLHSLTSQVRTFTRHSAEKSRFECKVIHHAYQELFNRAMYGTKDVAQRSDMYCERTMDKLDDSIGVFNLVLGHDDVFATLATRAHIAEFEEHLRKHLLVKHMATLGPPPQRHDSCEVRFLNRVPRWIVPPCGKASERIEIEADQRHAELLSKNLVCSETAKE